MCVSPFVHWVKDVERRSPCRIKGRLQWTADPESVMKKQKDKKSRRELAVALLLIASALLIAGWEVAARLAARPFDELRLKPSDFFGFKPDTTEWRLRLVHSKTTPTEPTAVAYELRYIKPGAQNSAPLLSRIVHGYNMVDCMRIKGYKVERLIDSRQTPLFFGAGGATAELKEWLNGMPVQVWRLTSSTGKVSIWATTMLRINDFAATATDTRDMAFPRIGSPDDPAWQPTGIKISSFRHPVRNARNAIKARWNASRCDAATFLRLRQPAWASTEMLTFVTEYHGSSVTAETEPGVIGYVLAGHSFMLREFQKFRHNHKPAESPSTENN